VNWTPSKGGHAVQPEEWCGWPTWTQGGECREGDAFVLQLDSNPKGQLIIGDQGSLYLFKRDRAWHSEVDFY